MPSHPLWSNIKNKQVKSRTALIPKKKKETKYDNQISRDQMSEAEINQPDLHFYCENCKNQSPDGSDANKDVAVSLETEPNRFLWEGHR